ncbi:MAG: membrane protein insertase YidC [Actinomycetes bacterium]
MSLNPLVWLETLVSWVLVSFHSLTSSAFDADSGWAWGLAIVLLVILIRIILIPLFVKQIKSQRNLQIIQPQVKEIQKKYAGDRERQSQELMKLYKETGTNPLSSCLPILAQAPIFYALFIVLQGIAQSRPKGVLTDQLVESARNATILNAPIYGTLMNRAETAAPSSTLVVTVILITLMTLTTFLTQRQLIVKNTAPDNPMVKQQKILLYVFPVIFAVTGINFPIGVLLYWFTTNLWTMGQQFYVIRNSPQPGTPAFEALEARRASKKAGQNPQPDLEIEPLPEVKAIRQQPKKKPKKKR